MADLKQQHLYKVLVIGDYAVGKTSMCAGAAGHRYSG